MPRRRPDGPTLALDGPPPLSLGLRRFVLRSVGPPAARFHPLDLSLVTDDGSVAQRALCVLTNTGGKSTLLKLLSAVVNPGTAGLIGKGEVADMVLATDTSHVLLEWQQADGTRYVTGWVAEWPQLHKPESSVGTPNQYWYTFRVGALSVDSLPFEREGRKVRAEEYRRQLMALFADNPAATGLVAPTQSMWRRALSERTRIDTELFMYQARMNAAESGAAALVTKLKTPEAVVGFFVEAFDDDARTSGLFKEISAYLDQAANRATMQRHADLCGELSAALHQFLDQDRRYRDAVSDQQLQTERRRELAGRILARTQVESQRRAEASRAHLEAQGLLAEITGAIDRDEDRRAQFQLVEAELRLATAQAAARRAENAQTEAELEHKAWSRVSAVIAHDSAVATERAAQAAFDVAEHELAPLRAQVQGAAEQLAAGLRARSVQAESAAWEAGRRSAAARRQGEQAEKDRERARADVAVARNQLERGEQEVRRSTELLDEGRAAGRIGLDERAHDAAQRWREALARARLGRRQSAADHGQSADRRRSLEQQRSNAELAAERGRAAAEAAGGQLADAAGSAAGLNADPNLADVLGHRPQDVADHRTVPADAAMEAAGVVEARAGAAEREAQATGNALAAVAGELDRLDGSDLLDPGRNVAEALAVLREQGIGALAGWSWIADRVEAPQRLAFVDARPDIANGVVVNDPTRLGHARAVLAHAGLLPRMAVVVTGSGSAAQSAGQLPSPEHASPDHSGAVDHTGSGLRFLIEPHPGLYDREKAAAEIVRLQAERDELTDRCAEQGARARALRSSVDLARRHAAAWPDHRLVELERELAAATERVTEAARARAVAEEGIRACLHAEAAAAEREAAHARAESTASDTLPALARAQAAEEAAAAHAAARPGLEERIAACERDANAAADALTCARQAQEHAATDQRAASAAASHDRDRMAELGATPADEVPGDAVHVLEAAHAARAQRLQDEAAGRDHFAALEQARQGLAQAARQLAGTPEKILERARALAGSVLAGTEEAIRSQVELAEAAWRAAYEHLAQCNHEVRRWEELHLARRPRDRSVHATLAADEMPSTADEAARRAADLSSALEEARLFRAEQSAAVNAAGEALREADEAASAFGRLLNAQDSPLTAAEPYDRDVDTANEALNERREAVAQASGRASDAQLERQKAAAQVARGAHDRRWGDIGDALKERCAAANAEELSEHGERYLDSLGTRERSLRTDLAELDVHRTAVINSLGQTCEQITRSLRRVRSASTIPSSVLGVGGHQAITIDFKRLPTDAVNAGLAEVVDTWAAQPVDRVDARIRQARLLQAVSATVERRPEAGRWSVRMLKPRIDGDVTYCTPDRISREYSGGQELTLAVLLYCTLAAVRADDRGGTDRPPGLLLLDNPFGAASSEVLIQMQQELAAAADVQLLCFTALSEPSILNGFNGPGTFRQVLRNDRDQRNGHQHVRPVGADDETARRVHAHLAGVALDAGEEALVSGFGYQTRPVFPTTAPAPAAGDDGIDGTG